MNKLVFIACGLTGVCIMAMCFNHGAFWLGAALTLFAIVGFIASES